MTIKFLKLFIFALLAFSVGNLLAQENGDKPDSDALLERYEESFQKQKENALKPISILETQFDRQLSTLEDRLKSEGDFDRTVQVKKVRESFREKDLDPVSDDFTALQNLQEIFLRERRKRVADSNIKLAALYPKYINALEQLTKRLTREDDLDKAGSVKEKIDILRSELNGIASQETDLTRPAKPSMVTIPGDGSLRIQGKIKDADGELNPAAEGLPEKRITSSVFSAAAEPAGRWIAALDDKGVAINYGMDPFYKPPQTVMENRIVKVDIGNGAVAVTEGGECYFWGNPHWAAKAPEDGRIENVKDATICQRALIVLFNDGTVAPFGFFEQSNQLSTLKNIVAIDAEWHTLQVLTSEGKVLAWTGTGPVTMPAELDNFEFEKIATGRGIGMGLTGDGKIVTWKIPSGAESYFVKPPSEIEKNTFREIRLSSNLLGAMDKRGEWHFWMVPRAESVPAPFIELTRGIRNCSTFTYAVPFPWAEEKTMIMMWIDQ